MPHRWNSHANLRRKQIESGADLTFNVVFKPLFVERIRALSPNKTLEVGCGTGHLSKDLFESGFDVSAIEPSVGMYEVSKDVLSNSNVILKNCSSFDLNQKGFFDVAFSHLVAHVVDDLAGFLKSIADSLSENGVLLFSIPHPCFYNDYKKFFGEDYNYMAPRTEEVSFTITKDSANPICGVPFHHRPLSVYVNTLIQSGFRLTQFEEVFPEDEIQEMYGAKWDSPRYCLFTCQCP